jgi:hypothetical protein
MTLTDGILEERHEVTELIFWEQGPCAGRFKPPICTLQTENVVIYMTRTRLAYMTEVN